MPNAVKVQLRMDQSAVQKMKAGHGGHVDRMMKGFAKVVVKEIQTLADQRTKRRTGRYRRSIKAEQISPQKIEARAEAPYSIYLEKGTRRHLIEAREGGVLAFKVHGRTVFARRVMHPGTKAKNIVRDGVENAGKKIPVYKGS